MARVKRAICLCGLGFGLADAVDCGRYGRYGFVAFSIRLPAVVHSLRAFARIDGELQ
jgi:hypothetical protein